jgi:hypothetical protein
MSIRVARCLSRGDDAAASPDFKKVRLEMGFGMLANPPPLMNIERPEPDAYREPLKGQRLQTKGRDWGFSQRCESAAADGRHSMDAFRGRAMGQ